MVEWLLAGHMTFSPIFKQLGFGKSLIIKLLIKLCQAEHLVNNYLPSVLLGKVEQIPVWECISSFAVQQHR